MHQWTPGYLHSAFRDEPVIIGDMPMKFSSFMQYCQQTQDEMPLYLFDKEFAKKAPQLAQDYMVSPARASVVGRLQLSALRLCLPASLSVLDCVQAAQIS